MNEKVYLQIKELADKYANELENQISLRMVEMADDDKSHYLIYRILGVSSDEGNKVDIYQNKGRFLYKYAGSFLEEAATICIRNKFPKAEKAHVKNTFGSKPNQFEIDCLVNDLAIELKWRDATTDGDHITKEHTRVQCIKSKGYKPIRIMFYYPQREQAKRIQETLKTLYLGIGGEYHCGEDAWTYLKSISDVDLMEILEKIADGRGLK